MQKLAKLPRAHRQRLERARVEGRGQHAVPHVGRDDAVERLPNDRRQVAGTGPRHQTLLLAGECQWLTNSKGNPSSPIATHFPR